MQAWQDAASSVRRKIVLPKEVIEEAIPGHQLFIPLPLGAGRADRLDTRFYAEGASVPLPHQWADPPPNVIHGVGMVNRNPDPRAVEYNERLYFGCVRDNSTVIAAVDAATGLNGDEYELRDNGNADDHRTPAIVVRDDGRLLVFWNGHGGAPERYWISTNPEDVTSFGPTLYTNHPLDWHWSHLSAWLVGERVWAIFRGSDPIPGAEHWQIMWSDEIATALPGPNLITNPSFETNTTGWDESAAGTTTITRTAEGGGEGEAPEGSWFARCVTDGTVADQGVHLTAPVDADPDQVHSVTVSVRAPEDQAMTLEFTETPTIAHTEDFIGTGAWRLISTEITTDAATTGLDVTVRLDGTAAVTFDLDFVRVIAAPADGGAAWSEPLELFDLGNESYMKNVATPEEDRIDYAIVDGTPGSTANPMPSLYHAYSTSDGVFASDGTRLRTWAELEAGPIPVSELTSVAGASVYGALWNWSVARVGGRTAIGASAHRSTLADPDDLTEIDYIYAVDDGEGNWDKQVLCDAGGPVSLSGQPAGAGGIAINPADLDRVACSRNLGDQHEMWIFERSGADWSERVFTDASTNPQFRPFPVYGRDAAPEFLYVSGPFTDLDTYETELKVWPPFPPPYTRTDVWVRVDPDPAEDLALYAYEGATDRDYEPDGDPVWDSADKLVHGMTYADLAGYSYRESLSSRPNRRFEAAGPTEVAGLHGRSLRFAGAAAQGVTSTRIDLPASPELEIVFALKADTDTGTRNLVNNFADITHPYWRLRIATDGKIRWEVVTEANTVVGGTFNDTVIASGADHLLIATFDQANGCRVKLDDVWSATTFPTLAALDATAPANVGVRLGNGPDHAAFSGDGHFARIRNEVRSDAAHTLDKLAWLGSPLTIEEAASGGESFTLSAGWLRQFPLGTELSLFEGDDVHLRLPSLTAVLTPAPIQTQTVGAGPVTFDNLAPGIYVVGGAIGGIWRYLTFSVGPDA